jgi:hypothetical protein
LTVWPFFHSVGGWLARSGALPQYVGPLRAPIDVLHDIVVVHSCSSPRSHLSEANTRAPSLVILGNDAVLAARPASPVQLAHACLALGYDGVVPASWGDELVADAAMHRLEHRHAGPALLCSCPHVSRRVLHVGAELQPFLVSLVAPPVAAARYLRALWEPSRIRLTFVGRCPGASDDAIDARISPQELLGIIQERGISLEAQPQVFEEVIPPDRRRYHSTPAGIPHAERLRDRCGRELVELRARELSTELAEYLLADSDVVLDANASLGCACSGATSCATPRDARVAIGALEPPRAHAPILVELERAMSLDLPMPTLEREVREIVPNVEPRILTSAAAEPVAEAQSDVSTPSVAEAASGEIATVAADGTTDAVHAADTPDRSRVMDDMPIEDVAASVAEAVTDAVAATVPGVVSDAVIESLSGTAQEDPDAQPLDQRRPSQRFIVRRRPGERPRRVGFTSVDRLRTPEPASQAIMPAMPEPSSQDLTPVDAVADASTNGRSTTEGDDEPQSGVSSEMETLRLAAERALAPFIASVQAMEQPADDASSEQAPRSIATAPLADSRRLDVATPIAVAREPGVTARDPETMAANDGIDSPTGENVYSGPVRDASSASAPTPPWAESGPTLKTIASRRPTPVMNASVAATGEIRTARPKPNASRVIITPPHPSKSRKGVIAGIAIILLAGGWLAFSTGFAARLVDAVQLLGR